jgi:hypothetical protein
MRRLTMIAFVRLLGEPGCTVVSMWRWLSRANASWPDG